MTLPAIALRNLARNRRRTLLSLLVIAAGATALVATAGFVRASFDGLQEALVASGLGHLEVLPAGTPIAATERAGPPSLADWQALRARVEALPRVRAAGGVLHLTGLLSRGERQASFMALASEPDRERRMGFELKLRGGDELPAQAPEEGQDRVLLGGGLARALGAGPGDVVTLFVMTPGGNLNAVDMQVAGLMTTGLQELDSRLVKLHLVSAQRLLESDQISSLVITLDDATASVGVSQAIGRLVAGRKPELSVLDWQTRAPFYGQVRALYAGIFWFMGGIVFVLVCLSTSNSLLMSVMERVREMGTLLALGTSRGQIGALILFEALWLGLIGAVVGGLGAWLLARTIHALGISLPPPPGAVEPIPLELTLVPGDFALTVVLMLVILTLAVAFPLVRTLRLRIVDALGHV